MRVTSVTAAQVEAAGGDLYVARALNRVVAGPGCCWIWTGGKCDGYAHMKGRDRKDIYVHRMLYEHFKGPIPPGLQIDHLCRVRACVNPSHLDAVTQAENIRRGNIGRTYPTQTHCRRGHPFSSGNTCVSPDGRRRCRACADIHRSKYKASRRG